MKPITLVGAIWAAILATFAIAAADTAALNSALQNPGRSDADKTRDVNSKPVEVMKLLGIEPGMTVVDLIAAGGYNSEVLSYAVGPKGHVYAQNPKFVLEYREGANDKALSARLADNRLPNVERLDREVASLGLKPDSIDAAITVLNYHDIYNQTDGPAAAEAFLVNVFKFLKPGGVLGIIDHVGVAGADNAKLHRIPKALVINQAKQAGFTVATDSNILADPADDHTLAVFDPSIRGKTDRFFLVLHKPAH
jgi:predicted methyltransferase